MSPGNVAERELTRRSFLKAAALGAGIATVGAPLAGCRKSTSSAAASKTIRYWSYTSEANRSAETRWLALFPKADPTATVRRVFVPADQMITKVIGSAE